MSIRRRKRYAALKKAAKAGKLAKVTSVGEVVAETATKAALDLKEKEKQAEADAEADALKIKPKIKDFVKDWKDSQ